MLSILKTSFVALTSFFKYFALISWYEGGLNN